MKNMANTIRRNFSKYRRCILIGSVILMAGGVLIFNNIQMQKQPEEELKIYVYENEMETYLAKNVNKKFNFNETFKGNEVYRRVHEKDILMYHQWKCKLPVTFRR